MDNQKNIYWVIGIFLFILTLRLVLAFSISNFTYESYFHLRQVEQITKTGLPLYQDPLSYGGRELVFLPLFHYVVALFDLFLPLEVIAKIIPNLFIAGLTIIVYLLGKKITNNPKAALFSAFIAGFLPILFSVNNFAIESLFFPLVFLAIYSYFNLPQRKYLFLYLATFAVLCFTASATALIIIGFGIYLVLSYAEYKKIEPMELEVILFSVFFFLWTQLIFFKKTFLEEGASFIWKNIPAKIVQDYFPAISLPQALVLVSVITFLAGIYVVYRSLFQLKDQKAILLISLTVSTTLLAWFRLIEFKLSLAFFGIILAILFSYFYRDLEGYILRTKLSNLRKYLPLIVIILLAVSIIPSSISAALGQKVPTNEEISAYQWLSKNTPEKSGVVSLLEEGYLVTYYSQRKNFMDEQFSLVKNSEQRFADLNSLYTSKFQTQALSILDQYNIQYLVLTPKAKDKYNLTEIGYLDSDCFKKVYNEKTKIWLATCKLTQETEKKE